MIAADQAALKTAQTTLTTDLSAAQAQLAKDEAPFESAEQACRRPSRPTPASARCEDSDRQSIRPCRRRFPIPEGFDDLRF